MLRRGRYARGSTSEPAGGALENTGEALSNDNEEQYDQEAQQTEEPNHHEATLGEADTAIAQAWMTKRRQQLQMGTPSATAVDVDAVAAPSWGDMQPPIPQSSDALSIKRVTFNEFDAESSLSSRSIRTDKTPIASNRMPGAPERPRLLPPAIRNHNNTLPAQQDLSCKDVFDIKKWHGKVN